MKVFALILNSVYFASLSSLSLLCASNFCWTMMVWRFSLSVLPVDAYFTKGPSFHNFLCCLLFERTRSYCYDTGILQSQFSNIIPSLSYDFQILWGSLVAIILRPYDVPKESNYWWNMVQKYGGNTVTYIAEIYVAVIHGFRSYICCLLFFFFFFGRHPGGLVWYYILHMWDSGFCIQLYSF